VRHIHEHNGPQGSATVTQGLMLGRGFFTCACWHSRQPQMASHACQQRAPAPPPLIASLHWELQWDHTSVQTLHPPRTPPSDTHTHAHAGRRRSVFTPAQSRRRELCSGERQPGQRATHRVSAGLVSHAPHHNSQQPASAHQRALAGQAPPPEPWVTRRPGRRRQQRPRRRPWRHQRCRPLRLSWHTRLCSSTREAPWGKGQGFEALRVTRLLQPSTASASTQQACQHKHKHSSPAA
jgi:hypothetical protein